VERIVLDTNFLLSVFELKIDVFAEIERISHFPYRLYIVDKTIDELENLINTPLLSKKQAAKVALKLIGVKKIQLIKTHDPRPVDDILVDLEGYIVATADAALKRRLRRKGVRILSIRQKKYLVLE